MYRVDKLVRSIRGKKAGNRRFSNNGTSIMEAAVSEIWKMDKRPKKFEKGKRYSYGKSNSMSVTVIKRTECYVTVTGDYTGMLRVYLPYGTGLYGYGENIYIPFDKKDKNKTYLCYAKDECA